MTTYLDNNAETGMTDEELLLCAETWQGDLTGIDELMPLFSGLLRMGRLDLAMPIYERLLPMLEDVVGFTYAHIPQWIAWTEQHPMREPDEQSEQEG